MQIQGHATQLEMQRGGCSGTNAFVILLGPPMAFGHRQSLVCLPWCMDASEHPWVLCPTAWSWSFPGSPQPSRCEQSVVGWELPRMGAQVVALAFHHGVILGIDVGVLPSPS